MGILKEANFAFINKDYNLAIELYEQAIVSCNLRSFIEFNLSLCKKKLYEQERKIAESLHNFSYPDSCYEGHLDYFIGNWLNGWIVDKSNPALIFELKIKVNGVLFCTTKNDCRREDLVLAKKTTGLGGFSVYLPNELFDNQVHSIEVYTPDDHLLAQVNVPQQSEIPLHSHVRIPAEEPVSIIVPIYNAPDDLDICVQRLLKYTRPSVDIILIDDASSDERIQRILQTAQQHKNIRVFKNEHNLGFTKTVNRGIDLAGNNDVVFLNSDARVTPRWLEGLKAGLSTDAKIATVTPMSDRAGAFSAPNFGNENDLPAGVNEADYAVAFRRRSYGFYPTVPTGNGFCLYVRRSCINEIGALDEEAFPRGYGEENDFCMRARAAGWRNVIDDRTYVFHDRNKSFGGERGPLIEGARKIIDERYHDYTKAITVFSDSQLINLARFRARIALKDTENNILPRGLFVISTLTGGTPQTNRDLMLALQGKIEPWLLHCDSKVMSLYRVCEHKADDLIEQYTLKEPIDPLTHTSSEYDQVMAGWLTKADFEFVHIRHLAWHSLSLPILAKKAGSKVIMSFHDYYAVCPTVKLLDNERKFCGGKCTASNGKCVPELWGEESFPYLKNNWVYTWRDKFKAAVQICDAYITTHESVKETIVASLGVDESKFHVIPHGRNFHGLYQLAEAYQLGDVLKILVPGNINDAKGRNTILELLELDKNAFLEFHILGNDIGFEYEHPRLIFHGAYQRENFAEHVRKIKPHIGAVLSIWNETWCHTLTELWSVGLPAIVTDFPTVSQRVSSSGGGWVVDNQSALAIFYFIENLLLDSTAISNKVEKVKSIQSGSLRELNNHFMAQKYLELYS